jgi:hypothetical protein
MSSSWLVIFHLLKILPQKVGRFLFYHNLGSNHYTLGKDSVDLLYQKLAHRIHGHRINDKSFFWLYSQNKYRIHIEENFLEYKMDGGNLRN